MSVRNDILAAIREQRLLAFSIELSDACHALPWWRWLYRLRLERQLRLVAFAGLCYSHGRLAALRERNDECATRGVRST